MRHTDRDNSEPGSPPVRRPRVGLFRMTLLGLVAGVASGLLFGDSCRQFMIVGEAYVRMLQMVVLPFLAASLVSSMGRLDLRRSRGLALVGGLALLLLWAIGMLTIVVFSQSFPEWQAGSFYRVSVAPSAEATDLLALFVPENVFTALADSTVPAVVGFSIIAGLALAGVPNRQLLIEHLDIWVKVFTRINHYVVRLTPIGVFAISATASGTLSMEEFGRLQAYLFAYTGANLLLLVIVLPTLVTALTPFGYREVWAVSKESLVVALVTGKLLVVLPLLIESTEQLFQGRLPTNERSEAIPAVDVLYPLAYPFPHLGKLLGMLFIPFSAWFLGQALRWGDYPMFLAAGLFSYFGGPNLATPFLLDLMDLPRDMFQLFVLSGVYCGRLGDALGVMHLVTFALLTTCWFTGHFKVRVGKLVRLSVATVGVGAVILLGTRSVLQSSLQYVQPNDRVIAHMRLLESAPEVIVLRESQPNRVWRKPGQSLLDRVQERGVLRVGYDSDQLPFAYFNEQGELVGFDISLAHRLARDLGVSLELVPFDRATLLQQLEDDHFDVVMSALVGTLERTRSLRHTRPYLDLTLAFVVEDKQASQYSSMAALRKLGPVRIAYVELSSAFVAQLREELPDAIMVPLETSREFFERPHEELDALLTSAECGSAFCLLHPRFSVVIPSGEPVALPLVYAVADRDGEMVDFLNHWIDLRTRDGTVQKNYDYWISGKLPASKERRWCILRDELGWIK